MTSELKANFKSAKNHKSIFSVRIMLQKVGKPIFQVKEKTPLSVYLFIVLNIPTFTHIPLNGFIEKSFHVFSSNATPLPLRGPILFCQCEFLIVESR